MTKQEEGLFPTELKEPKIESPKLPPLHPQSSNNNESRNQNDNNNDNNDNPNQNSEEEKGELPPGQLQEQANDMVDQIVGSYGGTAPNSSANSRSQSRKSSKANSQQQSNNNSSHGSQQNSTKSSPSNTMPNTAPGSNRSSSSSSRSQLMSQSCGSIKSPKTAMTTKRLGKLPSKRLTYNQEMKNIPQDILHNPYVTRRLNIFPIRNTKPPRAAMSHVEYRNRSVPPMDELTEKILNGEEPEEEPTVDQLKNSANILRQMEKDLVEKSLYPEAKKIATAFDQVSLQIKNKSSLNHTRSGLEELIAKRNELLALADSLKQDWDDKLSEQLDNTEQHVMEMKQNHQVEVDSFYANIPLDLTPLFKRNSVCYLNLRSKEKYLAFNRNFDEAQGIKIQADKIEEFEREANLEKMKDYYFMKLEKLKELQQLAIRNFLDYSEGRRKEMISCRDKSISGALKRAENIDKEIKRICEEKGIKQRTLNLDIVDKERLEMIKSREQDDPIPRIRVATGFGSDKRKTPAPQVKITESQNTSDVIPISDDEEAPSPMSGSVPDSEPESSKNFTGAGEEEENQTNSNTNSKNSKVASPELSPK